jgi:GAF domain-containing protein
LQDLPQRLVQREHGRGRDGASNAIGAIVVTMDVSGEGARSSHDSEHPPSSRSERQVELLLELGRATAEARDLDSLVAEAVDLALAALDADIVLLHEARGETLVLLGSATQRVALDPEMRAKLSRLSLADETLAGQCARSRRLVCASVEGWPSWCRSMASELGVRFGAAVPLLAGERLVGTLVALRTVLRPMTRHELRLLETSAAQLGAAI